MLFAVGLMVHPAAVSAATYVGAALGDVKPEDKVPVAHPQPVQLLFEFHTKGAPNGRATKFLKDQVVETVKASGLFSDVSDDPAPNGAVLDIVIDNVVQPQEMSDAEGKGFVTGATFFVAGSNITDHYVCTIDYVAGPTAAKITKTASQSVINQLGLINSPPPDAVKIGGMKDAVLTMTRQIVANPLNALAADPGFQPTPPPTSAPASMPGTTMASVVAQTPPAPAATSAATSNTMSGAPAPATPAATAIPVPAPPVPVGAPAPAASPTPATPAVSLATAPAKP
jgi:hypothetical protein